MRDQRLLVLGLVLVGIGALGLMLLRAGPLSPPRWSGDPIADGELIFRTGFGADGQAIAYDNGPMMLMSCATCHGDRGQGGRVRIMMRTTDVPSIDWSELTAVQHTEAGAEHPPYTEESLRRAVTRGIDPAGTPLERLMPRWQLTDAEWQALLAYWRTLQT